MKPAHEAWKSRVFGAFIALAVLCTIGCWRVPGTTMQDPGFRFKYEYTTLERKENGAIEEITRGSDDPFPVNLQTQFNKGNGSIWLELTAIDAQKVTFRVTNDKNAQQTVKMRPGETKEVFFDGSTFGLRIKLVDIRRY